MIHAGDGDFGGATFWPEGGLRWVPDPRKGRSGNIAMADFGLSAFALFFMQSASFLSFQRALERGQGRSNCQTLSERENPFRQLYQGHLDGADPALLAPCFQRTEQRRRARCQWSSKGAPGFALNRDPVFVACADSSARPGGAGRGCAAGASAG